MSVAAAAAALAVAALTPLWHVCGRGAQHLNLPAITGIMLVRTGAWDLFRTASCHLQASVPSMGAEVGHCRRMLSLSPSAPSCSAVIARLVWPAGRMDWAC